MGLGGEKFNRGGDQMRWKVTLLSLSFGLGLNIPNGFAENLSLLVTNSTAASSISGASITYSAPDGSLYTSFTVNLGNSGVASSVCSSSTIFGITGTASCAVSGVTLFVPPVSQILSTANHTIGSAQITSAQERSTYAGSVGAPPLSNYPSSYREIPDINLDDDGFAPYQATYSQYGTRPQVLCGASGALNDRIADCLSKNGSNATWDGRIKGAAGQAIWKLVFASGQAIPGSCSATAYSTDCYEVWQDQRTGLLWSSSVIRFAASTGINHCLASGNAQNVGGVDCTVATHSLQYAGLPGSACSESGETGGVQALQGICSNGTQVTSGTCATVWKANNLTQSGQVENYTSGLYTIAKGYMGALSSAKVRWRLPTKYDFDQADLDGIRFVMPDMGSPGNANNRANDGTIGGGNVEWTATPFSNSRDIAWVYYSQGGGFQWAFSRAGAGEVTRCVGR